MLNYDVISSRAMELNEEGVDVAFYIISTSD